MATPGDVVPLSEVEAGHLYQDSVGFLLAVRNRYDNGVEMIWLPNEEDTGAPAMSGRNAGGSFNYVCDLRPVFLEMEELRKSLK